MRWTPSSQQPSIGIVQKYGDESVFELSRMLKKGQASPQEALLQLGLIEDSATHTRLAALKSP